MFKKVVLAVCTMLVPLCFVGCGSKPAPQTIKVGTIAGPETQLMEVAKEVAKSCYNLNIQIVSFSDYNMPNAALNDGSIDANMFQHRAFLDAQIAARGYKLAIAATTFIFPMGVYSKKHSQLGELPLKAKVAIPNDPSNEARALLLLQDAGLLTLATGKSVATTTQDISANPGSIEIVQLPAAQLPRSLSDVDAAVINTNYAIPAGLSLRDALYSEGRYSQYANVVAVREGQQNDPRVRELISALHSDGVLAAARRIFGGSAIPGWDSSRQPVIPCQSS